MRILLLLLATLVVGCTQQAPDCGALEIGQAWVRAVPAGAGMTAGYLRLRNPGARDVRVTGFASEAVGRVAMHRTVSENGQTHMEPVSEVVVPAVGEVAFTPGGRHLMLFEAGQVPEVGGTVSLRLACGDAEHAFTTAVREQAPAE